jgi:hypothetical protein
MMSGNKSHKHDDEYSGEEAQRRFEEALRGARAAAPMPMKDIVGKGRKSRIKNTALAKPK